MEESLPRAVIRFKQGFGRLIRSRADTGRVVVLDPRIFTARYGRIFLDALPPGVPINVIEDPPAEDLPPDF
jgi:ATP-dependent DNA helicase DinG